MRLGLRNLPTFTKKSLPRPRYTLRSEAQREPSSSCATVADHTTPRGSQRAKDMTVDARASAHEHSISMHLEQTIIYHPSYCTASPVVTGSVIICMQHKPTDTEQREPRAAGLNVRMLAAGEQPIWQGKAAPPRLLTPRAMSQLRIPSVCRRDRRSAPSSRRSSPSIPRPAARRGSYSCAARRPPTPRRPRPTARPTYEQRQRGRAHERAHTRESAHTCLE